MFKRWRKQALIFCVVVMLIIPGIYTRAETGLYGNVLIISQDNNYRGFTQDAILLIEAVLGHYQVKVERMTPKEYIEKESAAYDVVMVVVFDDEIDESGFSGKLAGFKGTLIWAGKGIGRYNYPVKDVGEALNAISVNYREKRTGMLREYGVAGGDRIQKSIIPNNFKTYSWFSDGKSQIPYISSGGNLTYISSANFANPLLLNIFADFLNSILYRKNYDESTVHIHLDGVNIFSDYENLKNLADVFNERGISFTFGFIPYVSQEGTRYTLKFDRSSRFIETIKYIQSKGGLPVIHLMPVSFSREREITYTSYENRNRELTELKNNINSIVRECVEAGIYPAGVESKYFKFSIESFGVIKEHFSTFFGTVDILNEYTQNMPYHISDTHVFNFSYPVNLGTYDITDDMRFSSMRSALEMISMVEGSMGGLYFPSTNTPDELNTVIDFLENGNKKFFDFLKPEYVVETADYRIVLKNGAVRIESLIEQTKISLFNRAVRNFSYLVQGFLVLSILVFMYFVVRLYLNARRNLFAAEDEHAKNDR